MSTTIRINTINNNTTSEVREAEKALLVAKIKALQSGQINRNSYQAQKEIESKMKMLEQLNLVPNLFEMIENNCTVVELEQKIKELGYMRLDINLVKHKSEE
jgi:hypothetical protein